MGPEGPARGRHVCAAAMLWAASMGAQGVGAQGVDPVVHPDRTVTFSYEAAADAKVSLALEGVRAPIAMVRGGDEVWSYTAGPLAPEFYYYHFEVNGKWVMDPHNMQIVHSLTAVANSFLVPGRMPEPWEDMAVPHGVVHRHTYASGIVQGLPQGQSEYYVYTPPGYTPPSYAARGAERYPVLYLLHGWSHVAGDWTGIGRANAILDAKIAAGRAKPMIVVMPLGYGDMSFAEHGMAVWQNAAAVRRNNELFGRALIEEVMPRVEKEYRVEKVPGETAIAGLSMGGLQALNLGMGHPELFGYVGG